MNLSKRSFILIAGSVLVILVALVAFFASRRAQDSAASNLQVVTVRRGTLMATVSATGAINPLRQAEMAFSATGPITKLNVKQGDEVKAGQVLAQLDTRALDLSLAQSEASLTSAQAKLDQLKNPSLSDVAAANASVASAQAALAQLKTPTRNDLIMAKSDVDKAKAALDQAQAAYDKVGGASNPYIGMLPQSVSLQQASLDYEKALAAYNAKVSPSDSQLKQATATLVQAQANVDKLTNPSAGDLQAAQAGVDQARDARDLAQVQLDNAILRAPFDGMVTHVDFDLGSFVPAGKVALGVADVSELRVDLNIDETDIARVHPGQDVAITLDAYPDVNINAKVAEVASTASTVQGVVNYVVTVALKPGEVPLKIGMTADANIVIAQKENVLLVPNQAIRAQNAKRLVTVQMPDGKTEDREIKLGMSNDQDTEVTSGLSEGDRVVVSVLQDNFGPPR